MNKPLNQPGTTIRFRVILVFGTLTLLGLAAAYGGIDGTQSPVPVLGVMTAWVAAPIAAGTAFFSFLLTGRPW